MAPHDAELVAGAPAERRNYLDIQLAQADPLYVYHLTRYARAHRQRNALLRQRQTAAIETWEEEMARSGAYIRVLREKLVVSLQKRGEALLRALHHGKARLDLAYKGAPESTSLEELEASYRRMMAAQRERELDRGHSLVGPHRDDLEILFNQRPARLFSSEGEKRLIVGALKIAEWGCLENRAEGTPLMLADDVGITLDRIHKGHLIGQLMGMGQVFATTPEVGSSLPSDAVIHDLNSVPVSL